MSKLKSKRTILIVSVIFVPIIVIAGYIVVRENHLFGVGCTDIIGDGYAMGTDPEPVVIGRSCNP